MDKCFTFLWKLENISYCLQKTVERIESPAFVVDDIDQTKWNLWLFPRGDRDGNYIGFFLNREADSKGADKVEINYELALVAKDGSVLKSEHVNGEMFAKGQEFGFTEFEKRGDVFSAKRVSFLPKDTLRARCRIWKIAGKMTEDVRCTALTRIGVEKRNLKWNVRNFITLRPEKKCTYQIKSIANDAPLISVVLSLIEGLNSDGIIRFELFLKDLTVKFSALKLFLIDGSGNRVACNQEEIWFDDVSCKQLTFTFTKKKLMEEKSMYLPEDTLTLLWEWGFSKGVVSEEAKEDTYGCICPEIKISDALDSSGGEITLLNGLVDSMKSLYDEHFVCDVKLKTTTSEFPAHKFILSASSSVFKTMFPRDMREKISDCVEIEDLSDDTISRMLLFIYTRRIENLNCECASRLYVAADKYAILSLKNECSSYMEDNLSPSNACEVLLLADVHADCDLKSFVQDYILRNAKQIINSEEWEDLMETNLKLAAETMHLLFK